MKRSTGRARWISSVVASAALAAIPAGTLASLVTWNQPAGGNWTGLNWVGGVGNSPPVAGDAAAFNLANNYNVNIVSNVGIANVIVGGSNVTFLAFSPGFTFANSGGLNVNSGSFTL